MTDRSRSAATRTPARTAAEGTDTFAISYGDAVSDGVPGPGAGNIEAGGTDDIYTFAADAGHVVVFDVLSGSAGAFRWRLEAPDGTELFAGLFTDRRLELRQTGTCAVFVGGAAATTARRCPERPR